MATRSYDAKGFDGPSGFSQRPLQFTPMYCAAIAADRSHPADARSHVQYKSTGRVLYYCVRPAGPDSPPPYFAQYNLVSPLPVSCHAPLVPCPSYLGHLVRKEDEFFVTVSVHMIVRFWSRCLCDSLPFIYLVNSPASVRIGARRYECKHTRRTVHGRPCTFDLAILGFYQLDALVQDA